MPRHGERDHVTTQQEDGHSQDKEEGFRRNWTRDTLILDLQPPENNNNNDTSIFVVKGTQSVLFCYGNTKRNAN